MPLAVVTAEMEEDGGFNFQRHVRGLVRRGGRGRRGHGQRGRGEGRGAYKNRLDISDVTHHFVICRVVHTLTQEKKKDNRGPITH